MTGYEITEALKNITVIVDTREQKTDRALNRYRDIGMPIVRQKLNFGDYSAFITIDDKIIDFSNQFAIERKMNFDELCQCYCNGRPRFEREFIRAKQQGAKIYLLVEDGGLDKGLAGWYRSQMHPNSLIGSIFSWLAKYDCQIIFCSSYNTGYFIRQIITKEIEERLADYEQHTTT